MERLAPFRLADWTVDPIANTFERGDERASVEPKAMQVLSVLAETPTEVVPKSRLFERVWDGRFVTDDVLTGAIGQLRRALGDNARAPRYIQTVPRQGYRLVVDVAPLDATNDAHAKLPEPSGSGKSLPAAPSHRGEPPPRRSWLDRRLVVVALAAAVPASALIAWSARAIWDDSRSRGAIEPTVTKTVVEEVLVVDGPPGRHPDALVAYQRARLMMSSDSRPPIGEVLDVLRHAVELDPDFAEAWALLARAHRVSRYHGVPAEIAKAETLRAALRAIELDPHQPDAHIVLGRSAIFDEHRVAAAERHFDHAIEGEPTHAEAWRLRAMTRAVAGRPHDALADVQEARRLDPAHEPQGWEERLRFVAGEPDSAIDDLRELLEARPEICFLRRELFELLRYEGRDAEAWAELQTLYEVLGEHERLERLRTAHAEGGLPAVERRLLAELTRDRDAGIRLRRPIQIAELAVLSGDRDLAFAELDALLEADDPEVFFVPSRPIFGILQGDPRYDRLLVRLGLADAG